MPTYQYECAACEHEFEEFQPITAPPLRTCPACGERKLQRLIGTGGGLLFRGSGFYQTDYRSESYKKAAEAEAKAAAPASAAGESGTAAGKPAADKSAGRGKAKRGGASRPSAD